MAEIHPITLPKWGIEMSEGTVSAWHLAVGTHAEKGAELVDIETEKIVNTLDLEVAGTLRRQLAKPGDVLPVGALIAVLADASVPDSAIDAFVKGYRAIDVSFEPKEGGDNAPATPSPRLPGAGRDPGAPSPTPPPAPINPAESAAPVTVCREGEEKTAHASPIALKIARRLGMSLHGIQGTGARGRVSLADVQAAATARGLLPSPAPPRAAGPAARKLAGDLGVDLASVTPTGPKGHATKQDVRDAADRVSPPAPSAEYDLLPVTGMRRSIATALAHAKQTVPHFYLTADVTVDALLALREQLNARANSPRKLSVNDLLVKAAAGALMDVPDVNVHWAEDGIRRFHAADICVAVAIEGGLLTPVVKGADRLDPWTISARTADLADRARKRTLTREEISGGTFTLSNLGMFGIRQFQAIINPPQGAILAVGTTRREARERPDGGITFASVMSLTLSCDHRAVDGALGARFLAALGKRLEDPIGLVL